MIQPPYQIFLSIVLVMTSGRRNYRAMLEPVAAMAAQQVLDHELIVVEIRDGAAK